MSNQVVRLFQEAPAEPTGRESELSLLLREHDEARASGRPRVVFVRGGQGVGKSYLTSLLTATCARRGVPVFEGGSGRDVRRTWGLVAPLVHELLTSAGRSGVPQGKVAELARALEPLRAAGTPGEVEAQRLALYDATCELVTTAGRACPVFLFPDLDEADRASLELVRYLLAVVSTPESRAQGLFVLTFRDVEPLPQPLAEVLARVSGRTLALSGFDLDGIRAFLSRSDVAQKLLAATGGNPEVLGSLLERPVPAADFFMRRVERLPELQRAVLAVFAVSPEALSVEMVAEVMGAEVSATAAVLDALKREHLATARVVDGRALWRFFREGEKAAFRATLTQAQVTSTARRIGMVLSVHGSLLPAAELLLEVSPADAAEVALEAAASLVRQGALEDAAVMYQRAFPLVGPGVRGRLAAEWAKVLAALGQPRAAARRTLEAARLGEPEAADGRVLDAAKLLLKSGQLRRARALLGVLAGRRPLDAAVRATLAEAMLLGGDAKGAAERCASWLQSNASAGREAIAFRNVLGKALLVLGQAGEAAGVFSKNVEVSEALGDAHEAALARHNEGVAAYKKGDRQRAIASWEGVPAADRRVAAVAHANLGSLYAESGDFELALENLSRALQTFSRFTQGRDVVMAASNLARLHHFLGDFERATELAEHALERARVLKEGYLEASAQLTLGAILLDRRALPEALRRLDEARVGFERVGNDGYAALAAALKARAHLASAERAQAEVELSRRCVEKGSGQLQAAMLEVELTRGELCLALNDLHGASRAASRAREALLERPDLEGPARTYFLMGRLRLAAADAAGAQAEFQRASRSLDELTQRVPPVRRTAFLSLQRRAEIIATVEPELRLPRALASLAPKVPVDRQFGFVGRSAALARITRQLEPIGRSNATVLIRGESGTGKELLAEALHQLSPRRHMPLIKVNCGAMVEELLLSELFGHEKGAFTGAIKERKGRFEMADGGTIFLDEIGDISPKAQVALLRVLQEREFERVGGSRTLKVDVRVICATNRDLETLIGQGRFRADLYYRLKGVMLELPPLRDRLEDLPTLGQHFLDEVAKEKGEPAKRLSDDALAVLARHTWPGNVRELENVIRSAAIFAEGAVVTPEAFSHVAELRALADETVPVTVATNSPAVASAAAPSATSAPVVPQGPIDFYELARVRGISLKDLRQEVETQCIGRALSEAKGNISEAARLLKMKRSRLSQIVNADPTLKGAAHGDIGDSDEEE
ncbi:MAG: sigma 54-interacting transcriptional regulator [Myxococcaceae bacterium]|jgi:transcriptional regulator with GAF, ATPase, and Fis domain/tetratricopeptide (TPR) repeat protein|nr:sigma 54-interacting transcriptional regulator [Myxococcaceae bacterium]